MDPICSRCGLPGERYGASHSWCKECFKKYQRQRRSKARAAKGFVSTLQDEVKTAFLKKVAIPLQKPEPSMALQEVPALELDPHRRPSKRFPLEEILEELGDPDFQGKDFQKD